MTTGDLTLGAALGLLAFGSLTFLFVGLAWAFESTETGRRIAEWLLRRLA